MEEQGRTGDGAAPHMHVRLPRRPLTANALQEGTGRGGDGVATWGFRRQKLGL